MTRTSHIAAIVLFFLASNCPMAQAQLGQITSNQGDGVLNAPYRGTISSLRVISDNLPCGETRTYCEPFFSTLITSSTISIWIEGTWDRSVIRLFEGVDASGTELDLTGTDSDNPITRSVNTTDGFQRYSIKAIGINTLTPRSFLVKFQYNSTSGFITSSRTFVVAPLTGSFFTLPGESEAFHFGTPLLDVKVGGARLVVPIGRTAEMIGATFEDKVHKLGPSIMQTTDVLFPGTAESVFIQNQSQFLLNSGSYKKTKWGTPWPRQMVGFYNSGSTWAPDGTQFYSLTSQSADGLRRYDQIRPNGISDSYPATIPSTISFGYNTDDFVTSISDNSLPANTITLSRTADIVTRITTSDGRGWTIDHDAVQGWITKVTPDSGNGTRSFTYNSVGRVTGVKDASDTLIYQFTWANDPNGLPTVLTEEKRLVDGAVNVAVSHQIISATQQRRKEFLASGQYRQIDLGYANADNVLTSMTQYEGLNGTGTARTTAYQRDINNAAGCLNLTKVTYPDGSTLSHEYDNNNSAVAFGFVTKSTRATANPGDGNLVVYDVDFEFTYNSNTQLLYQPRIVAQRDGRGAASTVHYVYEEADVDEDGDGLTGADNNHLFQRNGPTVTLVPAGASPRQPSTRYTYDTSTRMLQSEVSDYGTGQSRTINYQYDSLLRLNKRIVDPGVLSITTEIRFNDTASTQDATAIDPDGYYSVTQYDNDGRARFVKRFLNNGGATGPFYQIENIYDTNGRLYQVKSDNKDQGGNAIPGQTNPIITQYSYDALGRPTQRVVDPGGIGGQSNYTYDWMGNKFTEYDTSGRGVKYVYGDGRGLLSSVIPLALGQTPAASLTTSYQYDANARLVLTTKPTGVAEQLTYDPFGRVSRSISIPIAGSGALPAAKVLEYDSASNITRSTAWDNFGNTTPPTGTVLSDETTHFDEQGLVYETRRRSSAGVDGSTDRVYQRVYDWMGNVISETDLGDAMTGGNSRIVSTSYDGANRVTQVTDLEGGSSDYHLRDNRGNVTKQVVLLSPGSAETSFAYDALGRVIRRTDPNDAQGNKNYTVFAYDSRDHVLRETLYSSSNTAKLTTVFEYDALGRQAQRATLASPGAFTDPITAVSLTADRVEKLRYDVDGRETHHITYNNKSAAEIDVETLYDSVGRVQYVNGPGVLVRNDEYASNGRLDHRDDFDGISTRRVQYGYDGHDRINQQTAVGSPNLITHYEYDGLGRPVRVTDPQNVVTQTHFNLIGERDWVTENLGGGALERTTTFSYDRLGDQVTQSATNRSSNGSALADQITRFRYDTMGRLLRIFYPDSTDVDYEDAACLDCVLMAYDAAGRLTSRKDQRQWTSAYTHDQRGYVNSVATTKQDGSQFRLDTLARDEAGRVTQASRGTVANPSLYASTAMQYSGLGAVSEEDHSVAGGSVHAIIYDRDQRGNPSSTTYSSGVVIESLFTAMDLPSSSTFAGQSLSYSYFGNGIYPQSRITVTSDPNISMETDYGFDSHRRENLVRNVITGSTQLEYGFTFDNLGNPLTQSSSGPLGGDSRILTFDALSRMTHASYSGSVSESISLDLQGNREHFQDTSGTDTTYGPVNVANEYATVHGVTVAYDAVGNLVTDENGRHYSYDEKNELIEVRDASSVLLAQYTYDALGRRATATIGSDVTHYFYDGAREVEERASSGVLRRYYINGGLYVDERAAIYNASGGGTFEYPLLGANYSVVGTAGADGLVTSRYAQTASGDYSCPIRVLGCNDCPFSGCTGDATGDGCINLSDLAAVLGRFGATLGTPAYSGCADINCDDIINLGDLAAMLPYYGTCCASAGFACTPPASGSFALHGRPLDILPDGKKLIGFRARVYDPDNGRWLQRDPSGYQDGENLYEAFGGNPASFVDPMGMWIVARLAAILAARGTIKPGDIGELGLELQSNAHNKLADLTPEEVSLLRILGGNDYGEAFTADTLSDEQKRDADRHWSGLATPALRYRAEANYATRRRLLQILLFRNDSFAEYVTEQYRLLRRLNVVHSIAEDEYEIMTGEEMLTWKPVSRLSAGADLVATVALWKVLGAVPKVVTEAAGGEVPGLTATAGRVRVYRIEGLPNSRIAIDDQGGVLVIDDTRMLFVNFGNRARADAYFAQKVDELPGAQIKSFEVSRRFYDELRKMAVPQRLGNKFPERPQVVDVTKAPNGDQLGLQTEQIRALRDAIIQGTGRVEGP